MIDGWGAFAQHDAVDVQRSSSADETVAHVGEHALLLTIEGIAPAAASLRCHRKAARTRVANAVRRRRKRGAIRGLAEKPARCAGFTAANAERGELLYTLAAEGKLT
jgi:hypothetical protein